MAVNRALPPITASEIASTSVVNDVAQVGALQATAMEERIVNGAGAAPAIDIWDSEDGEISGPIVLPNAPGVVQESRPANSVPLSPFTPSTPIPTPTRKATPAPVKPAVALPEGTVLTLGELRAKLTETAALPAPAPAKPARQIQQATDLTEGLHVPPGGIVCRDSAFTNGVALLNKMFAPK